MRYAGNVGYITEQTETEPGIWESTMVEFPYKGDVIRNTRKLEQGESLNKDVLVNNSISIVADQYANEHFFDIRYVIWEGVRWTVTNVEVQRPRLILSLGSVWNGPVPTPPEEEP